MLLQQSLEHVRGGMADYFKRTFPVREALNGVNDPAGIADKLDAFLDEKGRFVREPFVERQVPYAASENSLQTLAEERDDIDSDVARAFARYIADRDACDVHLYKHQEESLRAVEKENRNLIVCTGTGSGKTECFLLPIIDAIVRERKEKGGDYPCGVRAMILYPMNALVNDQVRRLRSVIRELPENLRPTFGLYTGELATDEEHPEVDETRDHLMRDWSSSNLVKGGDLAVDEDIPLQGELRHRWQWKDKPADILVTNYSMLERLLLLPETTSIFSSTWKFIVIDEAHSYTGSMGTEIAWLIRRVEKRVSGQEKLRYIATSATLRNGPDEKDNARWIADNFASKLFPEPAGSFAVIFGSRQRQEIGSALNEGGDVTKCDLVKLAEDNLFSTETLGLLSDEKTNAENRSLLPFMEMAQKGRMSANGVFHLLNKMSGIDLSLPAVYATDNVRRMIQLALDVIGYDNDDWKEKLHDPLDPRKAKGKNRQEGYQGNRLQVLDKWKEIVQAYASNDAAVPELTLTGEEFQYLYTWSRNAAEDFGSEICSLENLTGNTATAIVVALDLSKYAVTPTNEFKTEVLSRKEETETETELLANKRRRLTEAWTVKASDLGLAVDGLDIENVLHAILSQQRDVRALQGYDFSKIVAIGDVARAVFGNAESDDIAKLNAIFQIGMVARGQGNRFPMFDIRYHIVSRGLSDVALSFPQGDIRDMRVLQTTEPMDEYGNMRFSLGACRKCGQPYILAYSEASDLTVGDKHQLVREYTPSHCYLHALAWVAGNPDSALEADNKQEEADRIEEVALDVAQHARRGRKKAQSGQQPKHPPLFVNLKTGVCSTSPGTDQTWTRMVWVRHHEGGEKEHGGTRHIAKCPNCGSRDDNAEAIYGIITPYEGAEKRVKFEMLKHFAVTAEEDCNPRVRKMPGAGRKVLAFSDTRNGAASLALDFDETYRRQLFAKLIAEAVTDKVTFSEWDDEKNKNKYEGAVAMGAPSATTALFLKEHYRVRPKTLGRIGRYLAQNPQWASYLQVQNEERPEEWLDIEEAGRYCVLEALRDLARNGLLKGGFVEVRSLAIENAAEQELDVGRIPGLTSDQKKTFMDDIRELYRKIYEYLFRNAHIRLSAEWPDVDDYKWGKNHYVCQKSLDDISDRDGRRIKNFHWSPKLRDYVRTIIPETCTTDVSDDAKRKGMADKIDRILQGVFGKLHNLGILTDDSDCDNARCLKAEQLLDDAILIPGPRIEKAASGIEKSPPLQIQEHTAQISPEQGRVYQSAFANGKVNILSCSTTFEMGIDLGALNRVFLANMPPATANYKQRAGRAGRRPGAMPAILAFAGTSSHDRYFFDNPAELFDGDVEPPHIYLEKPSFRARHLRAEMLHHFLVWWNTHRNGGGRWRKLNDFFMGYRFKKEGQKQPFIQLQDKMDTPVIESMSQWLASLDENARRQIIQLADVVPEELGYDVALDLAFQLGACDGDNAGGCRPYPFEDAANHIAYLNLLGPDMPKVAPGGNELQEAEDPRRHNARKRILAKLRQYRDAEIGYVDGYDAAADDDPCLGQKGGNSRFVTRRQRRFLLEETISYLSSFNVIPKYGFPVDVVEMLTSGNTVRLQRDLKLGLYEYAPEQIVTADKKRFKSIGYFAGDVPPDPADPVKWYKCSQCNRLSTTPSCRCGGLMSAPVNGNFWRPESFVSQIVHRNEFKPRGDNYTTYAGRIEKGHEYEVSGCCLRVAESDTQMMRFLNAGRNSAGFDMTRKGRLHLLWTYVKNMRKGENQPDDVHNEHEILVHDIITNIVILTIPPMNLPPEFAADNERLRNALLSAMYAIREAVAKKFHVASRDIGAFLDDRKLSTCHNGQYSYVLYDNAPGGGGLVLPLLQKEDSPIPEILRKAKDICEKCPECGKIVEKERSQTKPPVSEGEYRNRMQELQGAVPIDIRLRAACPKCLKQRDHFHDAYLLDRFDAALVIENLLDPKQEVKIGDTKPVTSASLTPGQNHESLAQILDTLIAHPNRYATEVDKRFVSAFRSAIGDDAVAPPTREKEFSNGETKAKALLSWEYAKLAIFSSAKSDDVNLIRPAFDGWCFVVISDHIDMAELKARL